MIRTFVIATGCMAVALSGCKRGSVQPAAEPADSPATAENPDAALDAAVTTEPRDSTFAIAKLASKAGALTGSVTFTSVPAAEGATGSSLVVTADFKNAMPGDHGIHIHEFGDCSGEDYVSAGGHLNPAGVNHAGPTDAVRHMGDLGNIKIDENGIGTLTETLALSDQTATEVQELIIGKAVVLHENVDDMTTQPDGKSGKPLACGTIEKAETVAH